MPLLEFRNTEISYGGHPAVEDLSLSLEEGEILGIVGESGSGKSTVLKAAMGLLGPAGAVTKGDILYRGSSVSGLSDREFRRLRGPELGMIFQNCQAALCPVRTVGEQIYESMSQHERLTRAEMRRRAGELMEKLHLSDSGRILDSYPFEMSGGMNQRVGIVMAMLMKPSLLLADEPTSALDVAVQAQVVRELLELRELYHTGIVIVTHNIGVAARMADKAAVMHRGRLVEYGPAKEVFEHPREEYTQRLLAAVPRIRKR